MSIDNQCPALGPRTSGRCIKLGWVEHMEHRAVTGETWTNEPAARGASITQRPIVIVESPYAGNVDLHLAYARAAMRDCLLRGEAPFASHALYTQPGVLDDGKPDEREHGITAGFAFRHVAERTVVYTDLGRSPGMLSGIAHAEDLGQPVTFRSLDAWSAVFNWLHQGCTVVVRDGKPEVLPELTP